MSKVIFLDVCGVKDMVRGSVRITIIRMDTYPNIGSIFLLLHTFIVSL